MFLLCILSAPLYVVDFSSFDKETASFSIEVGWQYIPHDGPFELKQKYVGGFDFAGPPRGGIAWLVGAQFPRRPPSLPPST